MTVGEKILDHDDDCLGMTLCGTLVLIMARLVDSEIVECTSCRLEMPCMIDYIATVRCRVMPSPWNFSCSFYSGLTQ